MSEWYTAKRKETKKQTILYDVFADDIHDAERKLKAGEGQMYAIADTETVISVSDFYEIKEDRNEGMGR